ncbi:MAG: response regulator [Proteobacteria bacterium]|nr:response regulator [Pseudomonadota bacterium]
MAKILIADDSETLRLELKEVLEHGAHTVVEAADGVEGLKLAEDEHGIQLIISDYNMPGLDGITMVSKIKLIDRYKNVPVGMLTTESSKDLKQAGKEAGVVVWIVKPFDPKRLLSIIDKILEKYAA